MAIRFSCTSIIIPRGQTEKSRTRASLSHNNEISPEALVLLSKSSTDTKVYEDQALGVRCFRDERGEIVCEGFDEGPRFDQRSSARKKITRRNRELQISSFLQIMMIQAIEDDDFYSGA